jgi:sterol carrier protein 2
MGFGDRRPQIAAAAVSAAANKEAFKCNEVFQRIEDGLKIDGSTYVQKMKGVFAFKVKNSSGQDAVWIVDCKNGEGSVTYGGTGKADVTITTSDEDLHSLMMGKIDPQRAFFQGKLKIAGNMGLALKLKEFAGQAGAQSKL